MDVTESLIMETSKMREELVVRLQHLIPENTEGERFLENIKAYASDSDYFMKRKDYVRSFECVVWAWAWLEIGLEMNLLREE